MTHNFTAFDLAATAVAFAIFSLFVMIPGYVIGWLLDIFAFGRRTLLAQIATGISLSVAVVPIGTYLCWRFLPTLPWLFCAAFWVVAPVALARQIRRRGPEHQPISRRRLYVLAMIGGWVVLGTLCLVDLQIGHRLYVPVVSYDYGLRTAFTAAIERTGVPPTNPYFYPGHGYGLRYHYFWYMLCGLVARFGAPLVTARIAVIGGTLWSGIGLAAVVMLYVNIFQPERLGDRDKQMLVALGLLSVTGLDILPLAITFLLTGRYNASSEWWNEPVLSWVNSVFWQPHSIAALVSCATGFLVVWYSTKHSSRRARFGAIAIGGVAFASGLGLSIYVAFVFGIFLITWGAWLFFCRRWDEASSIYTSGVLALVFAGPYFLELLGHSSGGGSAALFGLTVRSFYFAEAFVDSFGGVQKWVLPLANALTLPLNYFLEFGFFSVVAIRKWKRLRDQKVISDEDRCGVTMIATSILICSFFRSNTISNNDLGWRGVIVAQFVLLIWAADLWDEGLFSMGKSKVSAAAVMLLLGFAATVYDVTMLRIYPILLDDLSIPRYGWLAPDHSLGERTYALRQVYERLDATLPKQAVIQQNPDDSPQDLFFGLYGNRQTVAETLSCGVIFGGSSELCPGVLTPINKLFALTSNADFSQVDHVCRDLSISALVVKDTDPVWGNKNSWIWRTQPMIENSYSKTFLCGYGKGSSTQQERLSEEAFLNATASQ